MVSPMYAFPSQLKEILEREDQRIASWNLDNTSFRIHDAPRFAQEILPRYFRHNKMSSFQRQLSLYEFKRTYTGPAAGSYHHPKFVRANVPSIESMRRAAKKGSGGDVKESRAATPAGAVFDLNKDFYRKTSSSSSSQGHKPLAVVSAATGPAPTSVDWDGPSPGQDAIVHRSVGFSQNAPGGWKQCPAQHRNPSPRSHGDGPESRPPSPGHLDSRQAQGKMRQQPPVDLTSSSSSSSAKIAWSETRCLLMEWPVVRRGDQEARDPKPHVVEFDPLGPPPEAEAEPKNTQAQQPPPPPIMDEVLLAHSRKTLDTSAYDGASVMLLEQLGAKRALSMTLAILDQSRGAEHRLPYTQEATLEYPKHPKKKHMNTDQGYV